MPLRRLLAAPGEGVTVNFRTNPNTRRVLRRVPDEEWNEFRAAPGAVTGPGAAVVDWKTGRPGAHPA